MIILAMSLALAFSVASQTEKGKCISKLKTETEKLQSAMFEVSIASPPTFKKVIFTMPVCGEYNVNALQFVYYSDPLFCRACPGQYGGCWQIVPSSINKDGELTQLTDAAACVNMAGCTLLTEQTAEDGCEGGIPLSQNPCPPDVTDCKFQMSEKAKLNSTWNSFSKKGSEQVYEISLTKSTQIGGVRGCGENAEVGVVKICVKPAQKVYSRE